MKTPTATDCPCAPLPDGSANPAAICKDLDPSTGEARVTGTFQKIVNILLYIAGIIAIIVIIISGIKLTASHGDSSAASKARQNLIYAVVGLIIAVSAFAIVNFVFAQLGNSGGGSGGGSGNSGSGDTTCAGGGTWDGSKCSCTGGRDWNGSSCVCPKDKPTWNGSTCS